MSKKMRCIAAALIAFWLVLSTSEAQDINPFQKPAATTSSTPIFAPSRPTPIIPPPLPAPVIERIPPPPVSTSKVEPASVPAVVDRSCPIDVLPARPTVPASGGEIVLRVGEKARSRGCINGIESRNAWLKIQYFNGQELTLLAEPNNTSIPRNAELIFANLADSLIVRVQQAAP